MRKYFLILAAMFAVSCGTDRAVGPAEHTRYASFFDIPDASHIVTISPYTGETDTLILTKPLTSLVCMSTSHVAYLDAIGMSSAISAVSGLDYVSSQALRSRTDVYDIGYEASLDYERIVALKPDLLLAYSVSSVKPQYVTKLESLGIAVLMVSDHLEDHPLARAEYIRLFGALTGTMDKADSVFSAIEDRYLSLSASVDTLSRTKVLFNVPYNDQWFIPGEDNYMSQLVRDAGGVTLGAERGARNSGTISLERAYLLSKDADVWLNPGPCQTRAQLNAMNPLFGSFSVGRIYNNTLRTNSEGGNDFWESGAARPDLVLEDLVRIFKGEEGSFNYYLEVD